MKKIIPITSGFLLIALSVFSQAAEIELSLQHKNGGSLSDGTRMATGRILCRDSHSGFHVWMNAQKAEVQSAHYIIKGQLNNQHEMRVRLSGDGWYPSTTGEHNGIVKIGRDENAIFDILIDGNQNLTPDRYTLSLSGVCI